MYQQLWGYKVEEKLYLGLREQKRLNTTGIEVLIKAKAVPQHTYGGAGGRGDIDPTHSRPWF
jgi:hypothetical protein